MGYPCLQGEDRGRCARTGLGCQGLDAVGGQGACVLGG